MLREFILQPNEVKRIQFEGKWLIVTQASGPIELTIGGTTPIIVDEKDRVHLRDLSPMIALSALIILAVLKTPLRYIPATYSWINVPPLI